MWGFATAAYLINWYGSEVCGFKKLSPAFRMILDIDGGPSSLS
jgi:hypothetical protein